MTIMDPKIEAESYLERNKLPQLFEAITSQLLFHKPENPRDFIVKYLGNVKANGTPTLLDQQDLETMFGMFDITNRGAVSVEQANNALRSILGAGAALENYDSKHLLRKEAFVNLMMEALRQAVPYKQA